VSKKGWEDVGNGLTRFPVSGGWLYENRTGGMAFVPTAVDSIDIADAVVEILDIVNKRDAS
jgi:hypothetical protein